MKIIQSTLENNLKYVSVEDKDSSSASILVLVKVGSRYEDEKISGLAHFVEHNFFKGTKSLPTSKDVGIAIEKLGGSSNAFTSYEYTGYYIKVPKENFQTACEIMADMIQNATFPKAEVERERGVIIEEIRMYEDIPMRKVSEIFMADIFGKNHPLGRDIAGNISSVNSLSREDIIHFTEEYYTGKNMLIAVAGGIDSTQSKKIIKNLFEGIPVGSEKKFLKYEKRVLSPKVNYFTKPLEQSHIIMGGFGISTQDKQRYALKVGLGILGKGFGSILFQTIREKLGLAYYINADHSSFDELGIWEINMGVDNKRVIEAITEVVIELSKFLNGEYSDVDLERAKNYIIGGLVTDLETSEEIAMWHGVQELLLGRIYSIDEMKQEILKVTKKDITKIWTKLIREGNILITGITSNTNEKEMQIKFEELVHKYLG